MTMSEGDYTVPLRHALKAESISKEAGTNLGGPSRTRFVQLTARWTSKAPNSD